MTQLDYRSPADPLGPRNRRTVLLVWGIVLIICGAACACLGALTPLALLAPRATGQPTTMPGGWPQVVGMIAMYAILAVALVWTGVGSIRRRRWVRPVVLVAATIWLVVGLVATAVSLVTVPSMQGIVAATSARPGTGPAPARPAAPPAALPAMAMFVGIGCVAVIFVVLPALLLWFYRDGAVRETLAFDDPRPRWTDRTPIPVLGMAMGLGMIALWLLPAAAMGRMSVFGWFARGAVGVLATLALAALFALAALWTYRLRAAGWWLAVALIVLVSGSAMLTMTRLDARAMYADMGFSPEQVDAMVHVYQRQRPVQMAVGTILLLGALGYAAYVRRWFTPQGGRGSA